VTGPPALLLALSLTISWVASQQPYHCSRLRPVATAPAIIKKARERWTRRYYSCEGTYFIGKECPMSEPSEILVILTKDGERIADCWSELSAAPTSMSSMRFTIFPVGFPFQGS
jgi:hypothetical protein